MSTKSTVARPKVALQRLVSQTARAASKHADLVHKLSPLLIARYGTHPSDVDADEVIDAIDYGQDPKCTLKYIDDAMTLRGYPPLANVEVTDAGRSVQ